MSMLLLPHQTAEQAFIWSDFSWSTDKSTPASFLEPPTSWDYNTPMHIGVTVEWDRKQLKGFSLAGLSLALVVDCPATSMRWTSTVPIAGTNTQKSCLIELPAGHLSRSLEARGLIVSEAGDSSLGLPPGAKIAWSDKGRLDLEGEGGRFPTEVVSFGARGLPTAAAWHIQVRILDLDDTFASCVRVLLNQEHAASDVLLDQSNPMADFATQVLRRDIIGAVLQHLATMADLDLRTYDQEHEDSIASVVANWCDLYLHQDLGSAVALIGTDARRFDAVLQSGIGFLEGMKP